MVCLRNFCYHSPNISTAGRKSSTFCTISIRRCCTPVFKFNYFSRDIQWLYGEMRSTEFLISVTLARFGDSNRVVWALQQVPRCCEYWAVWVWKTLKNYSILSQPPLQTAKKSYVAKWRHARRSTCGMYLIVYHQIHSTLFLWKKYRAAVIFTFFVALRTIKRWIVVKMMRN